MEPSLIRYGKCCKSEKSGHSSIACYFQHKSIPNRSKTDLSYIPFFVRYVIYILDLFSLVFFAFFSYVFCSLKIVNWNERMLSERMLCISGFKMFANKSNDYNKALDIHQWSCFDASLCAKDRM